MLIPQCDVLLSAVLLLPVPRAEDIKQEADEAGGESWDCKKARQPLLTPHQLVWRAACSHLKVQCVEFLERLEERIKLK